MRSETNNEWTEGSGEAPPRPSGSDIGRSTNNSHSASQPQTHSASRDGSGARATVGPHDSINNNNQIHGGGGGNAPRSGRGQRSSGLRVPDASPPPRLPATYAAKMAAKGKAATTETTANTTTTNTTAPFGAGNFFGKASQSTMTQPSKGGGAAGWGNFGVGAGAVFGQHRGGQLGQQHVDDDEDWHDDEEDSDEEWEDEEAEWEDDDAAGDEEWEDEQEEEDEEEEEQSQDVPDNGARALQFGSESRQSESSQPTAAASGAPTAFAFGAAAGQGSAFLETNTASTVTRPQEVFGSPLATNAFRRATPVARAGYSVGYTPAEGNSSEETPKASPPSPQAEPSEAVTSANPFGGFGVQKSTNVFSAFGKTIALGNTSAGFVKPGAFTADAASSPGSPNPFQQSAAELPMTAAAAPAAINQSTVPVEVPLKSSPNSALSGGFPAKTTLAFGGASAAASSATAAPPCPFVKAAEAVSHNTPSAPTPTETTKPAFGGVTTPGLPFPRSALAAEPFNPAPAAETATTAASATETAAPAAPPKFAFGAAPARPFGSTAATTTGTGAGEGFLPAAAPTAKAAFPFFGAKPSPFGASTAGAEASPASAEFTKPAFGGFGNPGLPVQRLAATSQPFGIPTAESKATTAPPAAATTKASPLGFCSAASAPFAFGAKSEGFGKSAASATSPAFTGFGQPQQTKPFSSSAFSQIPKSAFFPAGAAGPASAPGSAPPLPAGAAFGSQPFTSAEPPHGPFGEPFQFSPSISTTMKPNFCPSVPADAAPVPSAFTGFGARPAAGDAAATATSPFSAGERKPAASPFGVCAPAAANSTTFDARDVKPSIPANVFGVKPIPTSATPFFGAAAKAPSPTLSGEEKSSSLATAPQVSRETKVPATAAAPATNTPSRAFTSLAHNPASVAAAAAAATAAKTQQDRRGPEKVSEARDGTSVTISPKSPRRPTVGGTDEAGRPRSAASQQSSSVDYSTMVASPMFNRDEDNEDDYQGSVAALKGDVTDEVQRAGSVGGAVKAAKDSEDVAPSSAGQKTTEEATVNRFAAAGRSKTVEDILSTITDVSAEEEIVRAACEREEERVRPFSGLSTSASPVVESSLGVELAAHRAEQMTHDTPLEADAAALAAEEPAKQFVAHPAESTSRPLPVAVKVTVTHVYNYSRGELHQPAKPKGTRNPQNSKEKSAGAATTAAATAAAPSLQVALYNRPLLVYLPNPPLQTALFTAAGESGALRTSIKTARFVFCSLLPGLMRMVVHIVFAVGFAVLFTLVLDALWSEYPVVREWGAQLRSYAT